MGSTDSGELQWKNCCRTCPPVVSQLDHRTAEKNSHLQTHTLTVCQQTKNTLPTAWTRPSNTRQGGKMTSIPQRKHPSMPDQCFHLSDQCIHLSDQRRPEGPVSTMVLQSKETECEGGNERKEKLHHIWQTYRARVWVGSWQDVWIAVNTKVHLNLKLHPWTLNRSLKKSCFDLFLTWHHQKTEYFFNSKDVLNGLPALFVLDAVCEQK